MKVYLVRHGHSQDRLERRKQRGTTPLSVLGRSQAEAVASRLQGEHIDTIISSPLARTLQTAKTIGEKANVPVILEPLVREREEIAIEGISFDDPLHSEYLVESAKNKFSLDWRFKNQGESFGDQLVRARKFRDQLLATHLGKNVLIVTHGWFINSFIVACIFTDAISNRESARFIESIYVKNTAISELEFNESRGYWLFKSLNDHLHIKSLE